MTQPIIQISELGPDPFADDPFFKRRLDAHWNACIGRQGDEENYVDGYMEAARELVAAVIDGRQYGKRDTLVLPILYNARHAVELVLKFVTDRLSAAGIMRRVGPRGHDVMMYWTRLNEATVGDEKLREEIAALRPYVRSLDHIDSDGQELRYHVNRENERSLDDRCLANLEVIQESLEALASNIYALKNRTLSFLDERATGTYTTRCSRRDLEAIANMVPRRDMWLSDDFEWARDRVKQRYGLSNTAFASAMDAIQKNRELNALLGVESTLLHISDEKLEWLAGQWRLMHPQRDEVSTIVSDFATIRALIMAAEGDSEVVRNAAKELSDDELGDVDAMFYIARDRIPTEYYQERVLHAKRKHAAQENRLESVDHLLSKTNFLSCIELAAKKLGKPSLARKLAQI